jgi:DNA-binding transcriptional LysR family regulator
MRELRRLVHSPHHLFVFEACGRLLSFTRAAEELGVTQPAVSLAIRQLETAIGHDLFERRHRAIRLTDAGERFYNEVSLSFERLLQAAREVNRGDDEGLVTLSISTAFANYWVMPRMTRLHRSHPKVDLRLQVVDKDNIAREEIFAVASPAYLQSNPAPKTIEDLLEHQFIHLEEPFRPRPAWRDWFASFGVEFVDRGEGLRLNDYALVIQAAMAGEGIAIGWRHVTESLIKKRLLVPVLPQSFNTGEEFHLIWSDRTELSESAQQVRDWIIEEAKAASMVRLP